MSEDPVEYDCGWCGWTYTTDSPIKGLSRTVRHYNLQHSIQGWTYRKLRSTYSDSEQ